MTTQAAEERPTHSIVVGGTRGIGRAVVRALAASGHTVSVVGRREPHSEDQQVSCVRHWSMDITDGARAKGVMERIVREVGPVRYLVFLQRYRGEDDAWAGELATSLTATKEIVETLRDHYVTDGDRAIVLLSSVIGSRFVVRDQPLSYHVGKAGMEQMVRYYAASLGPLGIRVNGVAPGTVLKDESRTYYESNAPLLELYERIIPLRRMGRADEIAQVVLFLCSPQASYVTGQTLVVDGGMTLELIEPVSRDLAGV